MNKASDVVLRCVEVRKEYVDVAFKVSVLKSINLSITRGEQVAIMGRSGSGKTTLLQLMGGLDLPTAGEVYFKNHNIHRLTEAARERLRNQTLGFIYQMHHLLPEFTALENVAMPLLIANIAPSKAKARARELLELVGLEDRTHHYPALMSGGERQRVAIARALVNNPDCVLADEPTGNLDEESASHVLEVMQTLNRSQNTSIVVVTHDNTLAAKMDRTLILQGGQLWDNAHTP
jgi:lipoprotein-releasing system ATP-binding protein